MLRIIHYHVLKKKRNSARTKERKKLKRQFVWQTFSHTLPKLTVWNIIKNSTRNCNKFRRDESYVLLINTTYFTLFVRLSILRYPWVNIRNRNQIILLYYIILLYTCPHTLLLYNFWPDGVCLKNSCINAKWDNYPWPFHRESFRRRYVSPRSRHRVAYINNCY